MKNLEKIFNIMGVGSTETCILNSLNIPKNVQNLSLETGISRTGINYCLNSLSKRGLIRIIRDNRKKRYIGLTEEELISKLQKTVDDIKTSGSGKKGARIKTTKEDEFIIHVGTKEIIPAYKRIAFENKNERVRAIQHHKSYNELQEKISSDELIEFNEAIIKNHIIIDGILNESAYLTYKEEIKLNPSKYKKSVKSLEGRMADYTFFTDNIFNYNAELWLFKNTSLFINWHDEVAIEITNKSITAFLKDMFEFVKKDGQKVDHNKAIKNVL
ncbi:MAG: helix-turn-helix domain-containing protein [Candidatus Taylorbacteria bacterium]|nr:helix-turn-helix domain-containing protein [Candidatus Taylorbacteria bacterium]